MLRSSRHIFRNIWRCTKSLKHSLSPNRRDFQFLPTLPSDSLPTTFRHCSFFECPPCHTSTRFQRMLQNRYTFTRPLIIPGLCFAHWFYIASCIRHLHMFTRGCQSWTANMIGFLRILANSLEINQDWFLFFCHDVHKNTLPGNLPESPTFPSGNLPGFGVSC